MNRLRHKLILIFLVATLAPLSVVLWMSSALLELSLSYLATDDLDRLSRSLEEIGREYYQLAKADLRAQATTGGLQPQRYLLGAKDAWPAPLQQFWESTDADRFVLSEPDGDRLNLLVRDASGVLVFTRDLKGVRMEELTRQISQARSWIKDLQDLDLPRGFNLMLVVMTALIWILALGSVVFLANRISRPVQELTAGLHRLAGGDLEARLHAKSGDEIGRAIEAFNHTAAQLRESRDRLLYLAQVASWQVLARKMAHELKNSLTPIRLTVEEILARQPAGDRHFLEQAVQVVVNEVEGLERRVRAFSEFATEPQARPEALDLNSLLEERIHFLKVGHPEVSYRVEPAADLPAVWADADQMRGILTNLLENAAEAAQSGGTVLGMTLCADGKVLVEVHDSGPGLSAEARQSLFEPSISFKKHGMGLGLSISRKNALLAGGDLQLAEGRLGGAAFRLVLPAAPGPGTAPGT